MFSEEVVTDNPENFGFIWVSVPPASQVLPGDVVLSFPLTNMSYKWFPLDKVNLQLMMHVIPVFPDELKKQFSNVLSHVLGLSLYSRLSLWFSL